MTAPKLKLKKGDRVVVLSGKDIGKEGEITRVMVPVLPTSFPASTWTSSPLRSFMFTAPPARATRSA